MPLVCISYHPDRFIAWDELIPALAQLTAKELSCEDVGGNLEISHIATHTREHNPSVESHQAEVEIIIDATTFPSRLANLDERRANIVNGLRTILDRYSFYVWVRLLPGSFELVPAQKE
jgi:hypothetical protein